MVGYYYPLTTTYLFFFRLNYTSFTTRIWYIKHGRDGDALRKWLKNNKHIKVITRDRASAYAKVIAEELPDAMQVADRFHLHQNLLEAIKKALNHELPATIKIPHNDEPEESRETDKKIAQDVDNSSNYSEKRYKMICQIQQLLKEGCSYREIARRMGVGRNTIAKYRTGEPRELPTPW